MEQLVRRLCSDQAWDAVESVLGGWDPGPDFVAAAAAAVKPVPDMGAVVDTRYLKGLATHAERMVMLLDVEKLMRPEDVETLDAALTGVRDVEIAA